jgi:hypothetical protein
MALKKPLIVESGTVQELPVGDTVTKEHYHQQDVPSSIWYITHNLGKLPQITIYDASNKPVIADLVNVGTSTIEVHFSSATSGAAFLS